MALFGSISTTPLSISVPIRRPLYFRPRFSQPYASLSSSPSSSSREPKPSPPSEPLPSTSSSSKHFVVEPSTPSDSGLNYALSNPNGNPVARFVRSTESSIERGCVYIVDAYKVYWTSCVKGIHTGQMVLRLVEAIDVYLAGTVMLIFGMGLYGLFISNVDPDVPTSLDRALKGSSLFGMFALKERPKWMKICSLDELKTKVGHVIVMILLVKMFERSKMVTIATGVDLLSYSHLKVKSSRGSLCKEMPSYDMVTC
ncbi:uncharacterized protein LOC122294550 isoform X3 [Carya illinoinensis]|uniref:uncharacterized protein LOC122294550 isoform X3 n=1 Tax=Carya illinoinensis TaxID=32201 RepID=UPI001C71C0CC|nr:uncharacterized protein LOC122294550 isoform X3 [Carya illinoinensis]